MKDSTAWLDYQRAETETTDKLSLSGVKGAIYRSVGALLRAQHARATTAVGRCITAAPPKSVAPLRSIMR